MKRRAFLRYLAALPFVGPALLAVGAKVAGAAPAAEWPVGPATCKATELTLEQLRKMHDFMVRNAHVYACPPLVIDDTGRIIGEFKPPAIDWSMNDAILEAFYRGRG